MVNARAFRFPIAYRDLSRSMRRRQDRGRVNSRASSSTAQPRSARRERHRSTFASPKVGHSPRTETVRCRTVLSQAAAMYCRDRSLRHVASPVPRVDDGRPHRAADAASLCEAIRQTAEERCRRGGSNLSHGQHHRARGPSGMNTHLSMLGLIWRALAKSASAPGISPLTSFAWPWSQKATASFGLSRIAWSKSAMALSYWRFSA